MQNEQIMIYLSNQGISQLNLLLSQSLDITIRKLSAKIICQLAYNSEILQTALCDLFQFSSFSGKVIINKWPTHLKEEIGKNNMILQEIKNSAKNNLSGEFWCFPDYKYSEEALKNKIEYIEKKQAKNNKELCEYCIF